MSDKEAPQIKYDVFVSFRGEDTRRGFLSHLVANLERENINVYVDYRLKRGDEIGSSLVEAIEGSFILLIIFSPHYASSPWCLGELMKILECKDKYRRKVIPIFYDDVEPTHVRHQSSDSYKNAFAQHQKEYDGTKVQSWRNALSKSANLSGFESSKFQHDAELVEKIVSHVNLELKSLAKSPLTSEGLVGIDEKITDMVSLIRKEPNDTSLIGIWGMGGLGKTTLAKEVFNKLRLEYAGSYFLADEKDQSDKNGIISLKKMIFSKLLRSDVEIDMPDYLPEHIVRKIGRMKVLIVLDNVNDPDHIKNLLGNLTDFGSGSRIIVTTRNEQVLKTNNSKRYQLTKLSSNEALELFNLNAFNQSDHRREYNELSKRVVCYAQGIPLVLKVLASHLCGNNKEQWESELDNLEKMPNQTVYDKLMWSYKDLDLKQQQIFLDLACFFVRSYHATNVGDLKFLLKDSVRDNSVVANLERLKSKTLITISEDNFVSIHDILQEMARKIVCEESTGDPGNRSRLWDPNDISEVLKTGKVTEAIRSMQIHLPTIEEHKLISHIIPKMSRLQFLEIHGKCDRDCFDQLQILAEGLRFLSNKLRFLYWYGYPLKSLPENLFAETLVILSLQNGKMEKLWDGVKNLVNLKEVDLSWSDMLKELPDLSKATSLEVLLLRHCSGLIRVHPSIMSLPKLEKLDLRWCKSLTMLTSYSQSRSLESLNLENCTSLQTLTDLPVSLEALDIYRCNSLQSLPQLPQSLKTLDASYCTSLQTLPDLPLSLEALYAGNCTLLQTLPKLPQSLKTLDASDCTSLQTLPDLPLSLEALNINNCTSLQTLPKIPQSLETLYYFHCTSLQTLTDLPLSLEALRINYFSSLQTLPNLPYTLKILETTGCTSLQTLPDLPLSLEALYVPKCTSLQTLPKLPRSLKTLNASDCTSLQTLPDLPLSLEALKINHCTSFQNLPKLPQSLKTLNASDCTSLQTLTDLPLSLNALRINYCFSLQTLPKLPWSLKILDASHCTSLQTLPDLPLSLKALTINHCTSLQTLPKIPQSLENLYCFYCTTLQTLTDLPLSLNALGINYCSSLQTLPNLRYTLISLETTGCTSLQTLPNLPLSLKTLYVKNCTSLQTLPKLPQSLKTLYASDCTSLQSLPDLPLSLEALKINHCTSLQNLPKLPQSLKTLDASHCTSLQALPDLPLSLEALKINHCTLLQNLPKLPWSLTTVNASHCTSLQTLPDFPLSLEALDFYGWNSL